MKFVLYAIWKQQMKSALLVMSVLASFITGPVGADELIEYKLAVIDAKGYVAKNDISVFRFRSLLRQLSEKYVESRQQIADITVKGQNILRDKGVEETLLNIMNGTNQIFSSQIENQKYAEYISLYVILRTEGQSHHEAISGLKALMRALGVQ